MKNHLTICSLSIILFLSYLNRNEAIEHLRYAAVIYRHGDRTPVNQYPTDPYSNESLWPVRFGELTNIGKRQHYEYGKLLRSRYANLISEKFDPDEVFIRSTDVDRTLMSASANLAGMFPPTGDSVWNRQLVWQPIPIHTVPAKDDEMLSMERPCPNYDIEKQRFKSSSEYKQKLQKYKKLMNYLTEHAGFEVSDFEDILDIYSDLKIEALYNLTLPKWTNAVFPRKMVKPACFSFTTDTATPLMTRLKVGPFLKQVIQSMVKVMHHYNSRIPYHNVVYDDLDGKPPLKLNIYSAHDLNIGSVLNALGLFDGNCPEYTSSIFFELYYDDTISSHVVKIYYRNTTDIVEPLPLTIPKCGNVCTLEHFQKFCQDIIPDNWEQECFKKFPMTLVMVCALNFLFLITAIGACYYPCTRALRRRISTANKFDDDDSAALKSDFERRTI